MTGTLSPSPAIFYPESGAISSQPYYSGLQTAPLYFTTIFFIFGSHGEDYPLIDTIR